MKTSKLNAQLILLIALGLLTQPGYAQGTGSQTKLFVQPVPNVKPPPGYHRPAEPPLSPGPMDVCSRYMSTMPARIFADWEPSGMPPTSVAI
jgi:hypothetical protein